MRAWSRSNVAATSRRSSAPTAFSPRCARPWRPHHEVPCGRPLPGGDKPHAHNRVEFLDNFFAAGKSGVVIVPLGTRLTAHELAFMVRDSGMRALVYDGAFAPVVRELRGMVELDHWVALDGPVEPGDLRYPDLVVRTPD